MNASDAAERLRDLRVTVESRPCLGLPQLEVGKVYLASVYPYRGCGFRVLSKTPKARVVMAVNVMDPKTPPDQIKLPKAHVEKRFYGESERGYRHLFTTELDRCLKLAAVV